MLGLIGLLFEPDDRAQFRTLEVDMGGPVNSKIARNPGLELNCFVPSPRAFTSMTGIAANGQLVSHLLSLKVLLVISCAH
jgi:hypothetical protein